MQWDGMNLIIMKMIPEATRVSITFGCRVHCMLLLFKFTLLHSCCIYHTASIPISNPMSQFDAATIAMKRSFTRKLDFTPRVAVLVWSPAKGAVPGRCLAQVSTYQTFAATAMMPCVR